LIIFRYDSELFYANANRFVDDVQALVDGAPVPVEWLILDASSLDSIDYSAGNALHGLLDYLEHHNVTMVLARVDTGLLGALKQYGVDQRIGTDHIFGNLIDANEAFANRHSADD
jgi:MFS superfamily sulfate permease-like transporter